VHVNTKKCMPSPGRYSKKVDEVFASGKDTAFYRGSGTI
jgi:hypothetical protein